QAARAPPVITVGLSFSAAWGPEWHGDLPARPLEIVEFRLRGDVLTPEELTEPVPPGNSDRRYAGVLGAGAHTHFEIGGWETAAGVDFIWTGPQTNLGAIHNFFHDTLGGAELVTRQSQIGDGFYLTAVLEVGREIAFRNGLVRLRPFVEVQAGLETFARAGADLTLGFAGRDGLLVRDNGTGHRYAVVPGGSGVALTLGYDAARVVQSELLPSDLGYALTPLRQRGRVGLVFQEDLPIPYFRDAALFLGWTWHSKEFETQREEQWTSSIAFTYSF
ncbi:MAG: lipid A-modifier LpxR family protein, partial [Pseudomonadota bacterium]